jgi:hypothetical protein
MKSDDDLERLLRRYEPAPPPASLRARALGARPDARRAWPWAAAAAAMLAAIVWLHGARARVLEQSEIDGPPRSREEEALLTDMLGGSDEARAIARTIVALDDASGRDAEIVGTTGTSGDPR